MDNRNRFGSKARLNQLTRDVFTYVDSRLKDNCSYENGRMFVHHYAQVGIVIGSKHFKLDTPKQISLAMDVADMRSLYFAIACSQANGKKQQQYFEQYAYYLGMSHRLFRMHEKIMYNPLLQRA